MASGNFRTTYQQDHKLIRSRFHWTWLLVFAAFLVYLPFVLTSRSFLGINLSSTVLLGLSLTQINFALIAIIGAVGLNLLTGYTGQISLGNAAFFAVGALVSGVTAVQWGWPFPLVLLSAGVVGALVGVIVGLPSLRLRGLYLLIATLALHFIANFAFMRYQVNFFGPIGITFERPSLFGLVLNTHMRWYALLIVLVAATILISLNLLRSRHGRAFIGVRDHDIAAASVGINVAATKLRSFALSSFLVSLAGSLYVIYLSNAQQEIFSLMLAIQFVAMIIIGGLGSVAGAVYGALLWTLLPSAIDTFASMVSPTTPIIGGLLNRHAPQLNELMLGAIIMFVLIVKPQGINGMWVSIRNAFQRWPYTT